MEHTYSAFMKTVSGLVLVTFSMLILEPAAQAAQVLKQEYDQAQAQRAGERATAMERTQHGLRNALDKLQRGDHAGEAELEDLQAELPDLDNAVLADFDAVKAHLQAKNLPESILQRHEQTVADYRREMRTLQDSLEEVKKGKDKAARQTAAGKASGHLKQFERKRHAPFDPKTLPFSIPEGKIRAPKENIEELKEIAPAEGVKVASAEDFPLMLAQALDAPGAEYLAETPDVQLTPDIRALAQSLEHHPVKIYQWVRDNIRFIPTYGSIQGAQTTLETRAGNAFDTSSLLIALLRASDIPARYQYGTIRVPIEKAMNWVGNVSDPAAAVQLLAQGGIPVVSQTQSGVIKFLKMEHIWVEAWVDFYPSRGAQNLQGDSWATLDASFKQYQYTAGMNLQEAVPFDAQAFANQLTQTAQINEAEGWVQGVDQNYIQTQLQTYQTQLETYINQTKPNATVGDVLGAQTIVSENRAVLPTGLPYQPIVKGNRFASLPDSLRKGFQFTLYADETARVLDNPLFSFSRSLPALAGKRLTLSFSPATDADRQLIESYLPEVPPGGQLDPATLPTSLPGYLIKLTAELKLNGETVETAGPFTMGAELNSVTRISNLIGGWQEAVNKPIAGEFYAFGIDGQGISSKQLEAVKTRMEGVKTQLEAQNFANLTKDGLIGDMLYAAALGYFAANDVNLNILNKAGQALAYRQPSFGTISTSLDPIYSFGVPRQVKMSGIMVDMDAVAQSLWAKNNDVKTSKIMGQQVGMMSSAFEHRVPELFFTDAQHPGEAVSAVKALAIASAQGQKIYQITAANVGVVAGLNIGQEVKDEIAASVAVGKEVTVSEGTITVAGWTGVGYIVADPETGAGAYRISGGGNGGLLAAMFITATLTILGMFFGGPLGILLAVYAAHLFILSTMLFLFIDTEIAFSDSTMVFNYARTLLFGLLAGFLDVMYISSAFIAILVMSILALISGIIYFSKISPFFDSQESNYTMAMMSVFNKGATLKIKKDLQYYKVITHRI